MRTPLFDAHVALGARMVDFAGWEMPVWYEGIGEEHQAVRTGVGLFDVSHMGELVVHGRDAVANLRRLLTNDVTLLEDGRAHYTLLLNDSGGTVDDLLAYRMSEQVFLLVVNASNTDKDRAWLAEHLKGDVQLDDRSPDTGLIAIQGPLAAATLAKITDLSIGLLPYYGFERGAVAGAQALVSRTGYTGEDGFEIMVEADDTPAVWAALLEAGREWGIRAAGLGARDSLRIEAAMPLYGHELNDHTSAYEAGLGYFVKLDKPEMLGMERLQAEKAGALTRKLVGFELSERGIARQGYPVLAGGQVLGEVTSGLLSPTLGRSIGMAYVTPAVAAVDTELAVDVRGREVPARVIRRPFYKRPRNE